jgi:Ca2+-binding EF-hand superfamily protein
LSKEEAQAANMPHIVKNFDAIDANKDGKVTPEELRAFFASQHRKHSTAQ